MLRMFYEHRTMAGSSTLSRRASMPSHSALMARARRMKLIEKTPRARMSEATKKRRAKARRELRIDVKCKSDPKILSAKFKAAVPSAHKITQLNYSEFQKMKKKIMSHISIVRAHAKRCNTNFKVPEKKK
ncbi:unnamed protein product [Ectocarpus sp. 8 AP-2014]